MRHLLFAVAFAAAVGCGETKYEPTPLTEDQKKAIQAEDQRVQDEESQGKGPGERKVKGKR